MIDHHYHIGELTFFVRNRSSDIPIIKEVIGSRVYFGNSNCPFYMDIRPHDVVIDIGAHIGSFSILAASKGAAVVAYEPFSGSFDLLKRNVEYNGFPVDINHQGVLGKAEKKSIAIHDVNFGGSSFFKEGPWKEEVDCITLSDVFDTNHIEQCNFLKLDCEGAEYEIIKDFPLEKIERIAVEWVGQERRHELLDLLSPAFDVWERNNDLMGIILARRKS